MSALQSNVVLRQDFGAVQNRRIGNREKAKIDSFGDDSPFVYYFGYRAVKNEAKRVILRALEENCLSV